MFMSEYWWVIVVVVVVVVVFIVLVLALMSRTHIQNRLFARTGIDAWREEASGISWRDRWILHRTTMRGGPAPRGSAKSSCSGEDLDRAATVATVMS